MRSYSSSDPVEPLRDEANVPAYWMRPSQVLSTEAGMHRFVWDLHYTRPTGMRASFPIAAVYRNTAREPKGVWAQPGVYSVKLTANGRSHTQRLTVKMDPRVKTPAPVLLQQFTLSKKLSDAMDAVGKAVQAGGDRDSLARVNSQLLNAYNLIQKADVAPTTQAVRAAAGALESFQRVMAAGK